MCLTGFTPRGTIILVIGMTLVAALTTSGWALDGLEAEPPSEGLGSVHTIVGTTLPDGHAGFGALYADLQTDVETRLRQADIRVDPACPERLLVVVDIFGEDDGNACLATVDVEIRQFALPARPLQSDDTPPVSRHHVVWARCAEIARQVRDDTRALVDQFITAYLDQHSKPSPPQARSR